MFQASYIELSASAVKNNIDFIRDLLGKNVIFSSVVKGNAYGHDIQHYCPLAYQCGVRHFSVFSAQEAWSVTQALANNNFTLMIMGYIDNHELEWAIKNDIEFYVFEQNRLDAAIATAKRLKKKANIHIELETGMNRTGFDSKEFNVVFDTIKTNVTYLNIKGICTHLAGAENIVNYKRIQDQIVRFKRLKTKINAFDRLSPKYHMASSSAVIRYPNTQLDLARIGILQYGFFPSPEIHAHYLAKQKLNEHPLKRIISWKTKVMDTRIVKAGEFVGYGTSYFTNQATRIALLPVGYSDGYSRSLSNQGKVLIKGKRLDIIGIVNMSMLAVNITNIDGVEKGDEAVLIGNQGDSEITVSSFSDYSQLINYELLTRLPQDIPRTITK